MPAAIDLRSVLHQTVSSGYGDLVTRRTGQAVRTGVERYLETIDVSQVTVIDFSSVRCLDYSCADEIIGKLLLGHGRSRYFLLKGLSPTHREAIEPVLERYRLAVVAQGRDGSISLLGPVSTDARRAFVCVAESGVMDSQQLAYQLSVTISVAQGALDELLEQRLAIINFPDGQIAPLA